MLSTNAWAESRRELREGFRKVLGTFPERGPVKYEVLGPRVPMNKVQKQFLEYLGVRLPHETPFENYVAPDEPEDDPGYRRLRIAYPSAVEGRPVYAVLRIPKGLEGKAPAVLCLHGHVAGCFFGKSWMDVTAIELTRRGFVTLTPDMLPFG